MPWTSDKKSQDRVMSGCHVTFGVDAAVSRIQIFASLPDQTIPKCLLCNNNALQPYTTPCDHTYCAKCIKKHCLTSNIPVQCFEINCRYRFNIDELQKALSAGAIENLLRCSFLEQVRANAAELQFCPSSYCDTVYAVSKDGTPAICTRCGKLICTACKRFAHYGKTCEESQEAASDEEDALEAWTGGETAGRQ